MQYAVLKAVETSELVTAAEQKTPKPRHRFAKGTSGNPGGRPNIGARAAELFDALSGDFGELSATDTILLKQAALLLARSERVSSIKQADVGLRMSGEARRLLMSLRRTTRAKDVGYIPLRDRLAAEFADENATSDEAEAVSAPADAADDARANTPATNDEERTGGAETPPEGEAA